MCVDCQSPVFKPIVLKPLTISILIVVVALICVPRQASAQWTQANGPYGGSATALAVLDDVLFATIRDVGVYRSMNDGESWELSNNGLPTVRTGNIVAIQGDLFLSTDSGLYASQNKGGSWELRNKNIGFSSLIAANGLLYLASNAVYRSDDNGYTWTSLPVGTKPRNIAALVEVGGNLVVATDDTVFVSSDDGLSWRPDTMGLKHRFVHDLVTQGGNVFAGSDNGIFISTNKGVDWTRQAGVTTNAHTRSLYSVGSDIYVGCDFRFFHSSDAGLTWSEHADPVQWPVLYNYPTIGAIVKHNGIVFGASPSSVLRSTNHGADWQSANIGIRGTTVNSVAFDDQLIYAASSLGLERSSDNGQHWENILSSGSNVTTSALGLFASSGRDIVRSTDRGATWVELGLLAQDGSDSRVKKMVATDSVLFVLSSYQVRGFALRSDGKGWRTVFGHSVGPLGIHGYEIGMALSIDNDICGVVYDGATYITTDFGESWKPDVYADSLNYRPYAYSFTSSDGVMYSAKMYWIDRSKDNGATWERLDYHFPASIHLVQADANNVYVGAYNGVFYSSNYGNTWTQISDGFSSRITTWIKSMSISPTHLVVGTYRQGVWTRPLTQIVSVHDAAPSAAPYSALHNLQVTPNPASESAQISFTLQTEAHVTVRVFDALGLLVATLADEPLRAQQHTFQWDAQQAPSGAYRCVLVVGDRVSSVSACVVR